MPMGIRTLGLPAARDREVDEAEPHHHHDDLTPVEVVEAEDSKKPAKSLKAFSAPRDRADCYEAPPTLRPKGRRRATGPS